MGIKAKFLRQQHDGAIRRTLHCVDHGDYSEHVEVIDPAHPWSGDEQTLTFSTCDCPDEAPQAE